MNSQKMAKSIGNVLLVKDLLEEESGEVIRLGLLATHYRQPMDWTADVLKEARKKLDRIYGVLRESGVTENKQPSSKLKPPEAVVRALEDDVNTPLALTELLAITKDANRTTNLEQRRRKAELLRAGAWLLGIGQRDFRSWFGTNNRLDGFDEAAIVAMVKEREVARSARNYAKADRIREQLVEHGVIIEDSPQGVRWRRVN